MERKLCESREKAQALVLAGKVLISFDGKKFEIAKKPGTLVPENIELKLKEEFPYVSRGGLKLEGALKVFNLKVEGFTCLDVGASTGGFTQCLLLNGAKKVYALDVGKGQLHFSLRNDPRVVVMEEINARYLKEEMFPEKFDLITVDVSFISLKKILPSLFPLLKSGAYLLALIKPQFEVGPKWVKKGVVKDPSLHKKVVDEIWEFSKNLNFYPLGVAESLILGPKGNKEFFILLKKP